MARSFLNDYVHALPAVFSVVGGSFLGVYGLERYADELNALQKFFLSVAFFTLSWIVVNLTARRVVNTSMPEPQDPSGFNEESQPAEPGESAQTTQ